MTEKPFAPKDAETLKSEIIEELGIEYEGNEDLVDKMVSRELKAEEFKASLHADKTKHKDNKEAYKQRLIKAGFDPETGEKLAGNPVAPTVVNPSNDGLSARDVIALRDVHEDEVDFLLEEAKLRGKSVAELKKDPYIIFFLKTKEEERKTAQATNTSNTRRASKNSDDLLKRVDKKEELSDEEMELAAKQLVESLKAKK